MRFTSREWHPRMEESRSPPALHMRKASGAASSTGNGDTNSRLSDAQREKQKTWPGIATSASCLQTLKPRCPTDTRDANSISEWQLNTQLPIGATEGCSSVRQSGLQPQKKLLPTRVADDAHPLKKKSRIDATDCPTTAITGR